MQTVWFIRFTNFEQFKFYIYDQILQMPTKQKHSV